MPYSFGGDQEGQPLPPECQPYWDCAYYGLAPPGESKDEDTNGDGMPDACEAFDFFSDEQSFEIYPGGSDEVQADPIRITVDEEEVELDDGEADVSTATDEPGDATGVAEQEAVALVARSRCSTACSPSGRLRTI